VSSASVQQVLERLHHALADRYDLDREIGHGGMATVYLAQDLRHGRKVAVKVLRPELAALIGPERFLREIQTTARLTHPNILTLHDSGQADGLLYYVMPYVDGETLRDRIRREGPLPLEDALRIATEVADALEYAHRQGVIHRDVKPANILLAGEHALVADFGLAKAVAATTSAEELSHSGLAVGTPEYMSPEQASGDSYLDGRADVYALGCVLFEMLAGQPPFRGNTAQTILARHRIEPIPSVRVLRPDLPGWVEEVIRRALAKAPADRYRSAAAFRAALLAGASGRGQLARWVRRAVLGVAGVAGGLLVWQAVPHGPALDPNKVMGFPLLVRGGASTFAVEQVEEAIAAAMQDTDPLRWLRARLFLGATAGAGLPADSATRVARARGARYWLGGSLSRVGDSVLVRLELFDAEADSLVDSRSVSGPDTMPAYALAFRAVNALLPKIVGRSTHVDQKYLGRHAPAAVAKWLEGEVAYRNGRYTDAMAFYREALGADSSLVSAALKAAMTAAWLAEYPAGDTLIRLALQHEADLPPLNRLFARGLQHQFGGNGDSALAWFRQAVNAAPEWSEGWYGLGEALYHLWPAGDNLDSLAQDAFRRSLALDPDFAPVVFHLAELTIVNGRSDESARLVERHRRLTADTVQQMQLDVMLKCVQSGPATVDWGALAARAEPGFQLLTAGRMFSAGGQYLDCAEYAYRAALLSPAPDPDIRRRWDAALGLHHIFIARGEHARARRFADSLAANGVIAGRGLWILQAMLGSGSDSAGKAEIALLQIPLDSMSLARLWWFGEWSAHYGDTIQLAAVADHLRRRAQASGRATDQVPARVMAARLLLLRGDTAGAIDSLQAIRPVAPFPHLVWRYWEALAPERLLLARLLLAKGYPAQAMRVAQSFDGQRTAVDVAYLPASLEVRRRAAAQMVDRNSTDTYERRLMKLSRR